MRNAGVRGPGSGVRRQGPGARAVWGIIILGLALAVYLGVGGAAAVGARQVIREISPGDCRVMEARLSWEGTPARVDAGRLVSEGQSLYLELDCRTVGGDADLTGGLPFTRPYPLLEDIRRRPALAE